MNDDHPLSLSSPRPPQFQLLFVLGATFYYLQNSTGEILRLVLPSNKDLANLPQELRGGREGDKRKHSTAVVSRGYQSSGVTLTFAGWCRESVSQACSSKVPTAAEHEPNSLMMVYHSGLEDGTDMRGNAFIHFYTR